MPSGSLMLGVCLLLREKGSFGIARETMRLGRPLLPDRARCCR